MGLIRTYRTGYRTEEGEFIEIDPDALGNAIPQGWECPRCHRINAPTEKRCECAARVWPPDPPWKPSPPVKFALECVCGDEKGSREDCPVCRPPLMYLAGLKWAPNETAADYVAGIHRALGEGRHLDARHIAQEGAARYPDDPELRKAAHILSPPRFIRMIPAEPGGSGGQECE